MSSQHCADHRVLEVIVRSPGSMLEEIVLECPDLTWSQVFVVINRLCREGVLTLNLKGRSQYAVRLSTPHHTTSPPRQNLNECM